MKSEPDIIKILREAEKKGELKKYYYELNNYNKMGFNNEEESNNEKELEKSEEKYRDIIEQGPDSIITLDDKGIITSLNKAALHLFGLTQKQYIGKHITKLEVINELDLKKYFEIYESLKNRKKKNILEFKVKQKNGTTRWCEAHISILRKEYNIIGSELIIRDNTKNRMVLNELRDAHDLLFNINKELEFKVKERTSEIRALIEQKDEFINQLSHDLKTPLTPIIILLPMLKDRITEPQSLELIEVISRNIYYIKDLIDKTIDLAKLNSSKIKLDINNIKLFSDVNKVIENNRVLLEDNKINIKNMISENIIVKADPLRLEELFNNLITNSIKYSSDEGGNITINAIKKEDEVTISIKDNGKGMEKDQVRNIFKEFYKIDQSRHNLDSSGLGLTICKRIVEKHGGKIWVESEGLEKGTTFYFTLKNSKNKSDEI
jgi:PAS domain S-box-containing protein